MNDNSNSRIRKIIYISDAPFQNLAFREAGLEYLQDHGYDVTVWTVGGIDKKSRYVYYDKDCDRCPVRHFQYYSEYEEFVKERKDDSIFILATLTKSPLLYAICFYKCIYFVMGTRSYIPNDPRYDYDTSRVDGETFGDRIREWYIRYRGQVLLYPLIKYKQSKIEAENRDYRASHTTNIVESNLPRAVFVSNRFTRDTMLNEDGISIIEKCNVVYTNSRAYNDYLLEEEKGEEITEDFILCANSGAGFYGAGIYKCHTEEDIYRPDEHQKYMKQIETMLDRLEEHYNMPVIVANHPRCELRGYDFGGRKIIDGRTCELSKKCKMFVTATTTAITYPILYNKPILFFFNDCIKDKTKFWRLAYVPLMESLELNGCNLDNEKMISEPWNYITNIRPEVKERFLETYHYEKEVKDKSFGEILLENVKAVE